jgi:hypothetical protein
MDDVEGVQHSEKKWDGLLAIGAETSMSSCCHRDHATLYSLSLSLLSSAELESTALATLESL